VDTTKNLKPFKSGDEWKGNPNGRPKGALSLTTILKRMIENGEVEMKIKKTKKNKDGTETTYYDTVRISPELLHQGVLKKACAGNTRAYELITNRIEGLPTQNLNQNLSGDVNLNINVSTNKEKDIVEDLMK